MFCLHTVSVGQVVPEIPPPEAVVTPNDVVRDDDVMETPPLVHGPELHFPDIDSANIQLSWGDFKQLLEAIQPREETSLIPPPFYNNIVAVDYAVDTQQADAVRVTAQYTIQVLHEAQLPLLDNAVAIVDVQLNGEAHHLVYRDGQHYFLTREPGEYHLEVVFDVPIQQQEGRANFRMFTPDAPRLRLEMRLAPEVSEVVIPEAVHMQQEERDNARIFTTHLRSTDQVNVAWQLPWKAPDGTLELDPAGAEAGTRQFRFTASSIDYLFAEKNVIRGNVTLRLNPLAGDLQEFRFETQGDLEILNVTAAGATWEREPEGEMQQVQVQFNHRLESETQVQVNFEIPLTEGRNRVEYSGFRVLNAVRQNGFLSMTPLGNVLLAADAATESVVRADASDMPSNVPQQPQAGFASPSMQHFRYTEPKYNVVMLLEPLDDVPVRVASIEYADFTTVITEERTAITRARFYVRNNFKQFLRVTLNPAAEVWSAEVAGQAIRPAKDQNENTVLIPLGNPSGHQRSAQYQNSYSVVLVYAEPLSALLGAEEIELSEALETGADTLGFFEALKLRTPAMDIIVDRLAWQVHLPENRWMLRYDGDVHYRPQISPYAMSAQEYRGGMTLGDSPAMSEGIQRFALSEKDIAALQPDMRQDMAMGVPQGADMASRTAGVLPVPIQVTSNTPAYHFERSIVPEGVMLNLSLSTYHILYLPYLGYLRPPIMLLTGLLLGSLLAAIVQRRSWGRLPFIWLVLFLSICVWMLLQDQVFFHQLVGWSIAGLVVSVLYAAARRGVKRHKQEAETAEVKPDVPAENLDPS